MTATSRQLPEATPPRQSKSLSAAVFATAVLTTVIAVAAFTLSFYALSDLAHRTGLFPEPLQYLAPIIVDLFMLQASLGLVVAATRRDRKLRVYMLYMLAASSCASIVGNGYHALISSSGDLDPKVSAIIAIIWPLAILASTHGLVKLLWKPEPSTTASPGVQSPSVPDHITAPSPPIRADEVPTATADRDIPTATQSSTTVATTAAVDAKHPENADPMSLDNVASTVEDARKPRDVSPTSVNADGDLNARTKGRDVAAPDEPAMHSLPNTTASTITSRVHDTGSATPIHTSHHTSADSTSDASGSLHTRANGVPVTDRHRELAATVREQNNLVNEVNEIAQVFALQDAKWRSTDIARVVQPHRTTITRWIDMRSKMSSAEPGRIAG